MWSSRFRARTLLPPLWCVLTLDCSVRQPLALLLGCTEGLQRRICCRSALVHHHHARPPCRLLLLQLHGFIRCLLTDELTLGLAHGPAGGWVDHVCDWFADRASQWWLRRQTRGAAAETMKQARHVTAVLCTMPCARPTSVCPDPRHLSARMRIFSSSICCVWTSRCALSFPLSASSRASCACSCSCSSQACGALGGDGVACTRATSGRSRQWRTEGHQTRGHELHHHRAPPARGAAVAQTPPPGPCTMLPHAP